MHEPSPEQDFVARQIVDSAFAVHTATGPGLLESVYHDFLACELAHRGIPFRREVSVPTHYRQFKVETGFRMDLVVQDLVVVELKAVEQILPVHLAQLDTYLKLSGLELGLLINFKVPLIKQGIRRRIRT